MVKFLLSKNVIVLTPDHNLNTAVEKCMIKDIGELTVIDFLNKRQVVGTLRKGDIMTACNKALLNKRVIL